jgi:DNA polymerase-4
MTLKEDSKSREYLKKHLIEFSKDISRYLIKKGVLAKTVTVKIKASNFEIHTKSRTLHDHIDGHEQIYGIASEILDEIDVDSGIRLIGLTVSNLSDNYAEQLSFFDNLQD